MKQAAFRGKDGTVKGTGPLHDPTELPENFEVESEGFINDKDEYVTRDEATRSLGVDHPVQSEELELSKAITDYKILSPTRDDQDLAVRALHIPSGRVVGTLTIGHKPVSMPGHAHHGFHLVRLADVDIRHQKQGLYGAMLQHASDFVKQRGSKGIASEGHWRSDAASGAWEKLSQKNPEIKKMPGLEGTTDFRLKEESLNKFHPAPDLPKLGVENRRETPITSDPQVVENKTKLMVNSLSQKYPDNDEFKRKKVKDAIFANVGTNANKKRYVAGMTGPAGAGTAISYASGKASTATKLHEDLHMMFNRVHDKYGHKAKLNLAHNLYNSIPKENKEAIQEYVSHQYGGKPLHPNKWHEEHLAHLVSYLNHPMNRKAFHMLQPGHWDENSNQLTEKGRDFQSKMKQAYRHLQQASAKAGPGWTKRAFKKSEQEGLQKMEQWKPSGAELDLALDMLNDYHDQTSEFSAAKFLSNQYNPTEEDIDEAMSLYEGNIELAALHAHKLPISDENLRLLRKVMSMNEVAKSEFDSAAIPRIVKPFNEESVRVADMIRDAYANNQVYPIKLGGKHSAGTAILRDFDNNTLWLLKPGSGKLSPALGVREEAASQSRREVAFNTIARLMGLGHYVPRAALVLLDGFEVAALEFFSQDYKVLDKFKKDPDVKLEHVFGKYVGNGLIYKWAAMDYILGQSDRHFSNIMMDGNDNIKFIDAGSSFAGHSFNPAKDPKSFIPAYLRAFTPRKFKVLSPQERMKLMPDLTEEADRYLMYWVNDLDDGQIIKVLNEFQINAEPVINRLRTLRNYYGTKSEFLKKFWAGAPI